MRRKHKYHRDEVRELEAIKDNTMTTTKPNPATEPTLEPCPFCGGPAEKRLTDGPKRGFIGCFTCMIGLPFNAPYGDTEVAAWNFRAPTNAPPLCPVHASLDSTDELELEIGNDCIACSLNQRTEMLKILEPHVPAGEQVDAVEFLRAKLAPASAAPIKHYFCSCGGALTAEEYITHYFELGHDRGDPAVAAIAAPVVDKAPIDMVLFCPRCGTQHIDAPEDETSFRHRMEAWSLNAEWQDRTPQRWTNPPHKSHLCHNCFAVWRPADVPTNGVAQIKTRGKEDNTWTNSAAVPAAATAAPQSKSCGFCAKSDQEVKVLIQATIGYICEECVAICAGIIERERTGSRVEQTVYVSEHPVTLHCNTCGLVQVRSFKCPCGDGQLVVGAAPVEQNDDQCDQC